MADAQTDDSDGGSGDDEEEEEEEEHLKHSPERSPGAGRVVCDMGSGPSLRSPHIREITTSMLGHPPL